MQADDPAALELLAGANPERAHELGLAWSRRMRAGDFEGAWRISDEARRLRSGLSCAQLPRHYQWVWNGQSLRDKTVLVRCYHGLGDTIQFIRYVALLRQLARGVVVWAQRELLPLLETFTGGIDQLVPLHDGSPECEFDADIELMELPYYFRSRIDDLPADVPYLNLEPIHLGNEKMNVGIVWRSGDWDPSRSIPFSLICDLARTFSEVQWHILQRDEGLAEWDGAFGVNSGNDEALAAARVIAALDLLITVDSMPAHLGGALARPTWTLLPAEADWRWMGKGDVSPWYPTMRLFRQNRPGAWPEVVAEVAECLRRFEPQRCRG